MNQMQISPQFGAKLVFDTNTMRGGKPTADKQGAEEAETFRKMLEQALPQLEAYPDMTLHTAHNFAYSRPEGSKHTTRHNFNATTIVTPEKNVSISRKERWLLGPEPLAKYLKRILAAAHQLGKPQITASAGADTMFQRPAKPPFPYI